MGESASSVTEEQPSVSTEYKEVEPQPSVSTEYHETATATEIMTDESSCAVITKLRGNLFRIGIVLVSGAIDKVLIV